MIPTLNDYLSKLFQFIALVPASILFFLPVRKQLRYNPIHVCALTVSMFAVASFICAWAAALLNLTLSTFLLPLLPVFFLFYQKTVKTDPARNLCVFFSVCALLSFCSNFSYAFDAWLHPLGKSAGFSYHASLFYCGLSILAVFIAAYPYAHYGSYLIENVELPQIWFTFLPVPIAFLIFNVIAIPHKYSTLHTNNVFHMYIALLIFMMLLMFFIYILFYRISIAFLENANNRERIRFFEMQQSQYLSQKYYMEQTEKLRHDFRQSMRTMEGLASSENWSALKKYLSDYVQTEPSNEVTVWCRNLAVNALLNYYAQYAHQNQIKLNWKISLPETLSVSEPDFCSLLGNLLENAIAGCMTVNPENRLHNLNITVRNQVNLYIVSVNNFDGNVKQKGDRYLSTKKRHLGTGLSSITMTAEQYGGIARFSHTESEFFAEVMMHMPCPSQTFWNNPGNEHGGKFL
ncbi:hypothetical protein BRYFOR_08278 [Marvinbryantia formatexigens DSM 14469]|uniref:Sensor histidine kinase NatK-like C-terminal domain-containing protein n=1 Tax=Marvinbryantia formatexigens DSM 14469 TaxID=478749 RepID=C6LI07_9FIRM|nr:GHKL domain-containing protein [Marvinbryantia formatexigens]EET59662.1 hypothetical protein BRYFOR_08278 [Marvinbryantia formatexigens DSM 14469]UWO26677.1 GHKL domain-containing protein [Marvinbryantia formatexigens DSM 14469]SDG44629.1 GHKL domain-containing protein [Marvinbryantia formatexigens]